jgi:cytochrome c biogenesis protein CcdA
MQQWIQQILSSNEAGFAFYPALFMLGMLGSVSSCCALPVIGAVVGYAGSRDTQTGRRELLMAGAFFMIGTMLSLAVIGALTGLIGHMGGSSLGRYWQFAAGLMIVLFGLVSLKLIQIRMPKLNMGRQMFGQGLAGAMLYGLALGGATTACSVGCNPLLPMALGAVVLKSTILMGALALMIFALGYSLPLAAGLVGLSFGLGRLESVSQRLMPVIRIGGGIMLISVGFYLLATI